MPTRIDTIMLINYQHTVLYASGGGESTSVITNDFGQYLGVIELSQ